MGDAESPARSEPAARQRGERDHRGVRRTIEPSCGPPRSSRKPCFRSSRSTIALGNPVAIGEERRDRPRCCQGSPAAAALDMKAAGSVFSIFSIAPLATAGLIAALPSGRAARCRRATPGCGLATWAACPPHDAGADHGDLSDVGRHSASGWWRAWPPPMHWVARPSCALALHQRGRSCADDAGAGRAGLGWPRAMAPPSRLIFSGSRPRSRMRASATRAASLVQRRVPRST